MQSKHTPPPTQTPVTHNDTMDPPHPAPPSFNIPNTNIGGFLKRLIPQGFDTGDLIIILLLLLMAGDCEEDRNNAILTIALYFLM